MSAKEAFLNTLTHFLTEHDNIDSLVNHSLEMAKTIFIIIEIVDNRTFCPSWENCVNLTMRHT